MLPEITVEELSMGLDAVVMDVLDQVAVEGPPVDAVTLAHRLGITVAVDARQPVRARYVRLSGARGRRARAAIVLRPEPRAERLQWALAHEIGEHVVHRVFAALGVDARQTGPEARESVANHLAGRLLLPGPWFAADGAECGWDLSRLKARYTTASHELIVRRMLELPPPVIISIFDQGQLYFRRSNVPGRAPAPSPAEIRCWRVVHERGRAHRVRHEMRLIQGWPVHEEGWKREILRTELETGMDCC